MYSAQLLKHFESPSHAGELADANAHVRVENPVCGDVLELSARIESGRIQTIRFRAKGCVPSMACGSVVCQLADNRSTKEALSISRNQLITELGGIPEASVHALQLALDALHKLLEAHQ